MALLIDVENFGVLVKDAYIKAVNIAVCNTNKLVFADLVVISNYSQLPLQKLPRVECVKFSANQNPIDAVYNHLKDNVALFKAAKNV